MAFNVTLNLKRLQIRQIPPLSRREKRLYPARANIR